MVAGGFDLGNAFGKVIIDPSGVSAGMGRARQDFSSGLSSMGDGLRALGGQIAGVGAGLTLLTAPITLFGKQGLDAASSFQNALAEIGVRARLTTDEMERVRAKALEIGRDTAFSAGQGAEAFLQLLTTGQSVEEAFATIDSVMAGAAASGADLGSVADAITDILAQFQLRAESSADVVNALARAAGSSSATMQDLIAGFQNVGGVANSFNLSVSDTAAILATFSENGIKGAEAGTQLRSMLNNMMRPTDAVQGMWAKLGTSMFDATGKMRPLNAVIADLNRAMAGMTEQERLEAIQTLAGTYGQLGLTALLNSEGFGAMSAAMNNATDAQTVAQARMKTFTGVVESLRGSVETLQINALTPLMENSLKPLIQTVTDVVNGINDWVVANPELASAIMTILSVVVVAGPALVALGGAISLIGTALAGLGTVVGIVTSPITLVIGAIVGLVAALDSLGLIDLRSIFDNLSTGFGTLFGVIGNFGNIVEDQGLGMAIASVINAFGQMLGLVENEEMSDAAIDIGNGIVSGLLVVKDFIESQVIPALELLRDWFVTTVLPEIIAYVQTQALPAIQGFFNWIAGAWETIAPALVNIAVWFIGDALPGIVNFITGTVIPAIGGFFNLLGNVWAVVSPVLGELARWFIQDALPGIVNFVRDTVIPGIQSFIDLLIGIWDAVSPHLLNLWNWFTVDALPGIVNFVRDTVIPGIQDFVDIVEGIWAIVKPELDKLFGWFTSTGLPIAKDAVSEVSRVWGDLQTGLTNLWNTVKPYLDPIVNWFRDTFQWIGQNFIKPVIDFINDIITKAGDALNLLRQLGGGAPNPQSVAAGPQLPSGFQPTFGHDYFGPYNANMPYLVGTGAQPELFVPNSSGVAIPNADKLLGGDTYNIHINASTYEGGQAAARGFEDAIREKRRSRG